MIATFAFYTFSFLEHWNFMHSFTKTLASGGLCPLIPTGALPLRRTGALLFPDSLKALLPKFLVSSPSGLNWSLLNICSLWASRYSASEAQRCTGAGGDIGRLAESEQTCLYVFTCHLNARTLWHCSHSHSWSTQTSVLLI